MKRCPVCNRTYTDDALSFCLDDGAPLQTAAPSTPSYDPNATLIYQPGRETSAQPTVPPPPAPPQPAWPPMPPAQQKRAVWPWILGGVAILCFMGIGLIIVIIALASISSNTNKRNVSPSPRPTARPTAGPGPTQTTVPAPSGTFTDDFSVQRWGTGESQYGETWYANQEYHMRANAGGYIVMYGPKTSDYQTENATVRVTTRSVDGVSPTSGYGLVVHGEKSKANQAEDYSFLIYTGASPSYRVVQHKAGTETNLVNTTRSSVIRAGTNTNQLEVRVKDRTLDFYINSQYITTINDAAGFLRGYVGFYSSDANEVAFNDLEITR